MAAPHLVPHRFQPGHVPPNKGTKSLRPSRVGAANSAIATCRTGGKDPIAIQIETARWLFSLGAKMKDDNPAAFERPGAPENAPVVDRVIKVLELAAKVAHEVAEFAYPKLSRIHTTGEAPTPIVENKMIVTLNIAADGQGAPNGAGAGPNGAGNGHEPPVIEHQAPGESDPPGQA